MTALAGSCLCGACTFTATPEDGTAHACHCGSCRQWSGGMFIAVACGTSVVFSAAASPATYQSSEYAERVFCPKCGSSLIWQFQGGTHQQVAIQAFEDPGQFELTGQVYIDHKPDNYALANETKTMTEAQINARVQVSEEAGL